MDRDSNIGQTAKIPARVKKTIKQWNIFTMAGIGLLAVGILYRLPRTGNLSWLPSAPSFESWLFDFDYFWDHDRLLFVIVRNIPNYYLPLGAAFCLVGRWRKIRSASQDTSGR